MVVISKSSYDFNPLHCFRSSSSTFLFSGISGSWAIRINMNSRRLCRHELYLYKILCLEGLSGRDGEVEGTVKPMQKRVIVIH